MRELSAVASWDEISDLYGAGSSPFRQFADGLVQWARVGDGERVVDLGCGNGLGLAALVDSGPPRALVGVDFSSHMLRACRQRLAAHLEPAGVTLVRADVESLPFGAESFDVAISSSVFQFVGYSTAALSEWKRVLARDSRLAFSIPAAHRGDTPDVNVTLMTEFLTRLPEEAQQRLLAHPRIQTQPPDLADSCRAAGFRRAEIEDVEFETTVANLEAWWTLQWTHGFRGFLREFDAATLQEMKSRAFELLEPRCSDSGEVIGVQTFRFCLART